jgi:hypothetical protein
MKCHQCDKPALFEWGNPPVSLCVDCQSKVSHIGNMEFLKHAAMANQALDDMVAITGFDIFGQRMPIAELARAMQKSPTLNNIVITSSQIGVLNTGNIQKIDAAITISHGSDVHIVGENIKTFTEGLAKTEDLDDSTKREIVELIEALSTQIVGLRNRSVIAAVMTAITEKVKGVLTLSSAASTLWNAIKAVLGG